MRLPICWFLIIQPVTSGSDSRCASPPGACRTVRVWLTTWCYLIILEPKRSSCCSGHQMIEIGQNNNRLEVIVFLTALLWWTCLTRPSSFQIELVRPWKIRRCHFGQLKYLQGHLNTCCHDNYSLFDLFEMVLCILMCSNFNFFCLTLISLPLIQLFPPHLPWLR